MRITAESTDWAGVRDQVAELCRQPAAQVFGSAGHGFELAPPLSSAELADLQRQLGVDLPAEYTGFLTQVGRGGAGPAYGVFPLRQTGGDGTWRWEGDGAELTDLTTLAQPFPRKGADPAALAALLADQPEEEDYPDTTNYDDACEAWDNRLADLLWRPERTVGAICICHFGCALRAWLVVSGPERGTVWADKRADGRDLEPVSLHGRDRVDFGTWYLDWLDQAYSSKGAPR